MAAFPSNESCYRVCAGCGLVCGDDVLGFEKFTLGTVRDPSEAWKYASFGLNPAQPANTLFGNCWT